MDSVKESSSVIACMPTPSPPTAPPPPPPPPMLNMNVMDNGRSQLLADIRKGTSLNKTSIIKDSNQNELSASDKLKKQTQDLLHAELSSTLKRRKPVVINEPPKYEYPIYNDSNGNVNSINGYTNSTNKTNDSSHSTSTNVNTPKPLNVNAVLSVVTGIKLPDIQYDANATTVAPKSQTPADKLKISHGKPNFTINHPTTTKTIAASPPPPRPSNPLPSPKIQIKPMESVATATVKLQRPSYFTSTSIDKTTAMPDANAAESQVEKCKSIFSIKSQKCHDNEPIKLNKSQATKSDTITKFDTMITKMATTPSNGIGVTASASASASAPAPAPAKESLIKKSSIDETANGISFASVANKKALFEKPAQGEIIPKTVPLKIQSEKLYFNKPAAAVTASPKSNGTLNSPRTITNATNAQQTKPSGITTVTLNKNMWNGSSERSKMESPSNDRVDHYERTIHTTTTTNTVHKYETKQFQQKTIVSFSKDLLNAPNNYPEQIRVKKTIYSERSPATAETPFHNIRFSIKTNGQVIPKPK